MAETKMAKQHSMAGSNASSLPSIVKSIHGPGVNYFYVSGHKKYDDKFWDTRANVDLYNWQFHRKKVKTEECNVHAEVPSDNIKLAKMMSERTHRKKEFIVKRIEEKNKVQEEYTASSVPDFAPYRLAPIVEERRVFKKDIGAYTRQRHTKALSEANEVYYKKLKKKAMAVDFGGGDFFRHHLKQMYKLTRFPVLNNHLLKGQSTLPDIGVKSSTGSSSPRNNNGSDTGRQSEQPTTDRSTKETPKQQPDSPRRLQKEGIEKKKTLVSARQVTKINNLDESVSVVPPADDEEKEEKAPRNAESSQPEEQRQPEQQPEQQQLEQQPEQQQPEQQQPEQQPEQQQPEQAAVPDNGKPPDETENTT